MPWSASDASRQAAQQRLQQQQQQQQRHSHQRNQQRAAKQMNDMMAQARALRTNRSMPATEAGAPSDGAGSIRRRHWSRVALVVVCVGLALAAGIYLGLRSGRIADGGVSGTVRSGSAWNLRAEPNAKSAILGQVQPGDQVIINCLQGGWAELKAPREGVFVSGRGLSFQERPPVC